MLGINITLVHFKEHSFNGNFHENEYGNLLKKFGPQVELPVLHAWRDNLLHEASNKRIDIRRGLQTNYAAGVDMANAAETL